ncbi:hypothetical protein HAX54_036749 [Datura stramonium]|uniref:Uncharacterized protein n=1 Tax=Datura stramonium TaxID=4076 RepID=A0ABS8VHF6_DATST|nr:hypothetical protein [Datura stramonium]
MRKFEEKEKKEEHTNVFRQRKRSRESSPEKETIEEQVGSRGRGVDQAEVADVLIFDRCFTIDVWKEKNYKGYVANVSILAFNFREGELQSLITDDLSEHDVTIMDYPRHYEGCPLLSIKIINHFLRSSESWLSLEEQNVLLMGHVKTDRIGTG